MKRWMMFLLSCGFAISVIAAAPIETGTFNNYAIYGYDPVAYFTQNKAIKGSKKISLEWHGAQWHFANQMHKDLFSAAPQKYAPQYGGYCAYAMSDGRFVGVDVDAFTMIDGKLYLNYSESVMQEWRAQSAQFIQQADLVYPQKLD